MRLLRTLNLKQKFYTILLKLLFTRSLENNKTEAERLASRIQQKKQINSCVKLNAMNDKKETLFEYEQRLKQKLKKSDGDAVERHALIAIINGDKTEFTRLSAIMKRRKAYNGQLRVVK